jgi:hypothetical protein
MPALWDTSNHLSSGVAPLAAPGSSSSLNVADRDRIAWELRAASDKFCKSVEAALKPLIPEGFSIDLEVAVRGGKIRVAPRLLFLGEGWRDLKNHSSNDVRSTF